MVEASTISQSAATLPNSGSSSPTKFLVVGDIEAETILVPVEVMNTTSKGTSIAPIGETSEYNHFQFPGGAWLLAKTIEQCLKSESNHSSVTTYDTVNPEDEKSIPHSFILTGLFPPLGQSQQKAKDKDKVVKLNRSIGWSRYRGHPHITLKSLGEVFAEISSKIQKPYHDKFDVAVIDDRNHGFRESCPDHVTAYISSAGFRIWNMFQEFAEGKLWHSLCDSASPLRMDKKNKNNTLLIIDERTLRSSGVSIREEGSAERSLIELARHLATGGNVLHDLSSCGDIVIRYAHGAFHYSSTDRKITNYLCEGTPDGFGKDSHGLIAGASEILTTAMSHAIAWWHDKDAKFENDDLRRRAMSYGVRLGIKLCELLRLVGYDRAFLEGKQESPLQHLFEKWKKSISTSQDDGEGVGLPKELTACRLSQFVLQLPEGTTAKSDPIVWEQAARGRNRYQDLWQLKGIPWVAKKPDTMATFSDAASAGSEIVRIGLERTVERMTAAVFGPEKTERAEGRIPPWVPLINFAMPVPVFGKLATVFSDEIDQFAVIESLVRDYISNDTRETPLCFAVFGTPGSGKSFTVQQILCRIPAQNFDRILKFNVAQFRSLDDLSVALHQVQDLILAQQPTPPVVFFDEFDCKMGESEFGWLKYFLAPMQDGEFKDGDQTYRIGRAIFVFAGGTNESYEKLAEAGVEREEWFRSVKGPDFISRLRGHLDITGVNHPEKGIDDGVLLRRAIILRQLLQKRLPSVFDQIHKHANIEPQVIRAFLQVPKYKHGVRSIEAIVEMSHVTGSKFTRSTVPTYEQLKMHVEDPDAFLKLMG